MMMRSHPIGCCSGGATPFPTPTPTPSSSCSFRSCCINSKRGLGPSSRSPIPSVVLFPKAWRMGDGVCSGVAPSPRCALRFPRPLQRRGVISYLPDSEDSSSADPRIVSHPSSGSTLRAPDSGTIPLDPFRGKSGSVSFCGLTHQLVEEGKLVSAPFKDGQGSLLWVAGPLALISSLLLPQVFLGTAIEAVIKDEILAEIISSFSLEVIFYAGLAVFLFVTDHVQRPYLEFSPKRWSLITGLKGYLSSAFFTMGFKVFAPLLAAYVAWPVIGLPAMVAVAPFLLGCLAQYAFEVRLDKCGLSCWPLLPIIFEVYRLYQLNRGAHFIERLMFSMRGSSMTPALLERSNALVSMIMVLQVLGVACLWSLVTFLLRLFPSRPVAEKY